MTKPIKDFRFVCAEGCKPGRWTSYHKAIRDMKIHGPLRRRGQGHGGTVYHRWRNQFSETPKTIIAKVMVAKPDEIS